ncbi:hypothetical protein H5410_040946 [Solanum commersonii]|uniref:Uncharacterized protein n=1 Tax=Solanum commersonii TaxID=4109 RepID=A0A9J5XTE7_SOLCO|nr:hypothetical protein H5410_040946 [Solanum commersonii]
MVEVQRWILLLLKPEERPTTRALKAGFISTELLTRYCKLIGHKYPDHICSKCNGEDNIIPNVDFEDQLMIYSNSRELRKTVMDEVQKWILSLLKPEERPTTRALKAGFISLKLLTRYCKLIGHKYPDHICSKCNGEDSVILDVQLE